MSAKNTLILVQQVMHRLENAGITTWLFGGWAEELQRLCYPRTHKDIDLLYPSSQFEKVDNWIVEQHDISLVVQKKFSHKRAFILDSIMVEILLLEPYREGHITYHYNNLYQTIWPVDTLGRIYIHGHTLPVASPNALSFYRQNHASITEAYKLYLEEQDFYATE